MICEYMELNCSHLLPVVGVVVFRVMLLEFLRENSKDAYLLNKFSGSIKLQILRRFLYTP